MPVHDAEILIRSPMGEQRAARSLELGVLVERDEGGAAAAVRAADHPADLAAVELEVLHQRGHLSVAMGGQHVIVSRPEGGLGVAHQQDIQAPRLSVSGRRQDGSCR